MLSPQSGWRCVEPYPAASIAAGSQFLSEHEIDVVIAGSDAVDKMKEATPGIVAPDAEVTL